MERWRERGRKGGREIGKGRGEPDVQGHLS